MDIISQNDCKKLVYEFVNEKLQGDIKKLRDYDFNNLREDKKYGCVNKYKLNYEDNVLSTFDADDTILAKAIYCLIWGEVFPDVNLNTIGTGKKYRGDTVNSFNTLFSRDLNNRLYNNAVSNCNSLKIGSEKRGFIIEDRDLIEKIINFNKTYRTIGNLSLLPNIPYYNKNKNVNININQYRGGTSGWRDFFDKFLLELRLYFLSNDKVNSEFKNLLDLNNFYFEKFEKSEDGFFKFCKINMFEYYILNEINFGINIGENLLYPTWSMTKFWSSDKNYYKNFCNNYIEKSTAAIKYRGDNIIDNLIKKLDLAV